MFLIGRIQNFSNEFRRNQQQFMKDLKELGGGTEDFDEDKKTNFNNSFDMNDDNEKNNFLSTQDDEMQIQMKKRNTDINLLANSIEELSGIFKDLQNVVQEQGTILDRIDYNIEVSSENAQKGLKYIKKAEEHERESCFRNVILVIFFIIFIETILIIMKVF
jgi:syntaxin 16